MLIAGRGLKLSALFYLGAMRRPPSLSDSFIYGGAVDKLVPLAINSPINEPLVEPIVQEETAPPRGQRIAEYSLRFLIHITLISVFETLFFFMFVSKDEDSGIMGTIDHYTNIVLDRCSGLAANETVWIDPVLERFINVSSDLEAASNAAASRASFNNGLLLLSCYYIIGLFLLMSFVAGVSRYKNYKIRWCYIITENLVLVSMLGMYEFMFFETVITQYTTATPTEITGMFIRGLQQRCGLLRI